MSSVDGTCGFVLDPIEDNVFISAEALNLGGKPVNRGGDLSNLHTAWTCPHDAEDGESLCIFHLPVSKKDDMKVVEALLNTLKMAGKSSNSEIQKRKQQFIGAQFGTLKLRNQTIGGPVDFQHAKFRDGVTFQSAQFYGKANFANSIFFVGSPNFHKTEFQDDADFTGVRFEGGTAFQEALFGGDADFIGSVFNGPADFRQTKFEGTADFRYVEFRGRIHFSNSILTDAIFIGTNLCGADFESAILSQAKLLGADLRGGKLWGTVLGDVRIDDNTQFLGHPSSDNQPSEYLIFKSRPRCIYDPYYTEDNEEADINKAKTVYQALEQLGSRNALRRLQVDCHVRRKDLQRETYKRDLHDMSIFKTPQAKLIAGLRWFSALISRKVILYGEGPWRTFISSILTIIVFAGLYPLGGWLKPENGAPIIYSFGGSLIDFGNSIYYSTLAFTSLGYGDFRPVGFGRVLTMLETGLGAVLIALLVFVLARRAIR